MSTGISVGAPHRERLQRANSIEKGVLSLRFLLRIFRTEAFDMYQWVTCA